MSLSTVGCIPHTRSSSSVTGGTLYLANGLQAVPVGHSGQKVVLADDSQSSIEYHANCDGGAAIPQADGGHIYVSNSEVGSYPDDLSGGVYALTFDGENKLQEYKQQRRPTHLLTIQGGSVSVLLSSFAHARSPRPVSDIP